MEKFKTDVCTLKKLADRKFIIPSYQRPYVWGYEQIEKLLSDFYEAFLRNDEYYYIGTVLLHKQDDVFYQVIDGQQRFTTLWLLAVSFKILSKNLESSEIENFLKVKDELRINFAIREQIKSYMLALLEKNNNYKSQYSDDAIEKDEYLTNIAKAVTIIIGKINNIQFNDNQNLKNFGNFIYEKIYFVVNTVPKDTDLNKLFSVINNSGIQLEQSDILKSLLLKNIRSEKMLYSRIWEACEDMSNFFEKNVKQLFPTEFNWANVQYDDLKNIPSLTIDHFSKEKEQSNALTIAEILEDNNIYNIKIRPEYFGETAIKLISNAKLSDIQNVSGKLFGNWIRNKKEEVEAEYCSTPVLKNEKLKIQLQIFDGNYAKGVEIEFTQNKENIDARITWAKASKGTGEKYRYLLGTDWNVETEDISNQIIPVGEKGYGVSEIVINPLNDFQIDNYTSSKIETEDHIDRCRSIINFPQLLIHAYRIFLYKQNKKDFDLPFHSDRLIEIFRPLINEDEQTIKDFFKCLWDVRWVFDKEIVKWIPKTGGDREEELSLTSTKKQDGYFSRSTFEKNELNMLQSMMYYTVNYNTQIWLTPYLKRLIDNEDPLFCLESIDNALSLSKLQDKKTSFYQISKCYILADCDRFDFESYLREKRGTAFYHYWFQKLEYILWKEFNKNESWKTNPKFKDFRIMSKNSVEHIFPQNPEFEHQKISDTALNDFGNLALLSVPQNSSYSNKGYKQKKAEFNDKPTYDSLKLALIYENEEYNEEKIVLHRNDMIEKLRIHYNI